VKERGERAQFNVYTYTPNATRPAEPGKSKFSGAPISINLDNADLDDVLKTFSELTGLDVTAKDAGDVKVTLSVKDMPWDEALVKIATDHGFTVTFEGKKITLHR